MATIGKFCLEWALLVSLFALIAGVIGARLGDLRFADLSRRAAWVCAGLITLAEIVLAVAIARHDFSLDYVASYSSLSLPRLYLVTVLWAGQSGSLLFWSWLLTMATLLFVLINGNRRLGQHRPSVTSLTVLHGIQLFFLTILTCVSSPFELLPQTPVNGAGLNPLLQNPWMAFHPPVLFIGYVGMAIPFALAIGALAWRVPDREWLHQCRNWAIVAWCFLTVGIVVGGLWAYLELGWGGYWAWDPVENASLIPWLTGTAMLHTLIMQERRGMLKRTNIVLIGLTFILTIFATFLTRSGILNSLHAFAPNYSLGALFLGLIVVSLILLGTLSLRRSKWLHSGTLFDSLLSRESAFLLGIILLCLLAITVFLGTTLPIYGKWVGAGDAVVGGSFYNRSTGPLFLLLLGLMGIAPMLAWRGRTSRDLWRRLALPGGTGLAVAIGLRFAGIHAVSALVGYAIAVFAVLIIVQRLVSDAGLLRREVRMAWTRAIGVTVWRRRRRYGALLAHLAIVLMATGVIASSFHQTERSATLVKDQSFTITGYELRYEDLTYYHEANADVVGARLAVYHNGTFLGTLQPEKKLYDNSEHVMTEPSRHTTPWQDLYVILAGVTDDDRITITAYVNPLVEWVWGSCFILVAGVILALLPYRREDEAVLQPAA